MIARRMAWLCCSWLLLAAGCAHTVERGYYAPVDVPAVGGLGVLRQERDGIILDVACQGVYLDTVDGVKVRTTHLQLDVTRTRPTQVLFPVDGLRVDFIYGPGSDGDDARPNVRLDPAEVWTRKSVVHDAVLVNPWSNKSLDVFFDHPDPGLPIPPVVRFRWRADAPDGSTYGDVRFLRILEDDPRHPAPLPSSDKAFGVRDGYYFPGHGDLGVRRLRDSVEARRHYLFHDP